MFISSISYSEGATIEVSSSSLTLSLIVTLGAIFSGSDQGNLSYIKDMTKKLNLERQVRFTGFVPNEEVNMLYSQSLALVMPT